MPVRWTTTAADDFAHVIERIREDNPAAAHRVAQTIYNGVTRLLLIALPMLTVAGCRALDPDYAFATRADSTTRLVRDSPEVRRLLEQAGSHDLVAGRMWAGRTEQERVQLESDIRSHPDKFMAERRALFDDMAGRPGVTVIGAQYFRLLHESATVCDPYVPIASDVYVLVRVTTGPAKGAEGWACDRDVQSMGYWVM